MPDIIVHFFQSVYHDFISFWNLGPVIELFRSGNYEKLLTLEGFEQVISPILPLLLLVELIRTAIHKKFHLEGYKMPFFIFVCNRFLSRFISLGMVGICIGLFEKYAIFHSGFSWYWLIYGYIVWEFAHFVYHYLAHKVRLFWCLHSTHHAPESMNLSVSYAHFFLEAPYADVIRTTICILAGVSPPLLFLIMFIDGTWGSFIHIGEQVMKNARLGVFEKWILTPSHHRVHHARNPLYMDTNFCNLLNIWDRVFGTLQEEEWDIPVSYGITREIKADNFWDVYFGEIVYLVKDVWHAPGLWNKIKYIFMPPGWSHTGVHKTASVCRQQYLQEQTAH